MPILTTQPFDRRSVAWDMAADITSPASALQMSVTLIPEHRNAAQPFFDNAARHLLHGVLLSFIATAPREWDFRDVVLALTDERRLKAVLRRTPETEERLAYFTCATTAQNIMATLQAHMARYEIVAACWSRARQRISLRQWLDGEGILLLGNDESLRAALLTVNQLLFKRLSELLLAQPDTFKTRTWIFLDEVREAGRLDGLSRLLTNGRSKGVAVALGFQDIEGLREAYGPRVAHEIVSQCAHKAVLRLGSGLTAEWAAKLFGAREVLEESTSRGEQGHWGGRARSLSRSLTLKKTENVLPSEFLDIPQTNFTSGLTGYFQSPYTGAFRRTLTPAWLQSELCALDQATINVLPRPEDEQYLRLWDKADRVRLGLESPPKLLDEPTTPARDYGVLSCVPTTRAA